MDTQQQLGARAAVRAALAIADPRPMIAELVNSPCGRLITRIYASHCRVMAAATAIGLPVEPIELPGIDVDMPFGQSLTGPLNGVDLADATAMLAQLMEEVSPLVSSAAESEAQAYGKSWHKRMTAAATEAAQFAAKVPAVIDHVFVGKRTHTLMCRYTTITGLAGQLTPVRKLLVEFPRMTGVIDGLVATSTKKVTKEAWSSLSTELVAAEPVAAEQPVAAEPVAVRAPASTDSDFAKAPKRRRTAQ